jgi:DNA adenine methylase
MMETKPTRPALRYHGGKFRLAPWVMSFFPPHLCYVEPFGGAAGVLLQKPRAYAEVYNDLDGDVVNFFRVIRDPIDRAALIDACIFTPYAREEFELAWHPVEEPIERARRLCIRAQMGFGSAGATKGTTGFRIDTKREYGTAQQLWAQYPDAIAAAGQRLSGVLIENRQAIDVMLQHDAPDTLHFVDPPYVFETRDRRARTKGCYRHEMRDDAHMELLEVLRSLQGMVVLSGYYTDLYDQQLVGWQRHETKSRISAGRGSTSRTECAWLNPACSSLLELESGQERMFA